MSYCWKCQCRECADCECSIEHAADRRREEELAELRAVARTRWNPFEWGWVGAYDESPSRCSVIVPPGRANAVKVESGEDLPGSWHQQANGGARFWETASGEFDGR